VGTIVAPWAAEKSPGSAITPSSEARTVADKQLVVELSVIVALI
jgi:hypothetical protein